jgi:hypothetical protein
MYMIVETEALSHMYMIIETEALSHMYMIVETDALSYILFKYTLENTEEAIKN